MASIILWFALTLGAVAGTMADRVAEVLASADTVKLYENDEAKGRPIVVGDAAWIGAVADTVRAVSFPDEPKTCLCCGWPTAHFFRKGVQIASLAVIHGNQLRISTDVLRGDFEVTEAAWQKVAASLKSPKKIGPIG